MRRSPALAPVVLLATLALAIDARAQSVELSGFGGYGFGGTLTLPGGGGSTPIEGGVIYGGTFSVPISPTWRVEALFSRQNSRVEQAPPGPHVEMAVERYMAGIQEEAGGGRTRAFGTFLVGATRFAPSGYDSEYWFTVALALGVKTRLTEHVGLRLEARGFYTPVTASGGSVCSGGRCIFAFSGSGLFQGDVSAGVLVRF